MQRTPEAAAPQGATQAFRCDEAKFFLKNCPGTQMDGDGDGVPFESQWCTGILGR